MRRTIRILFTIVFLVLLTGVILKAQSNANEDICIAINSKQFLYIGFENPVKLAVAGVPYQELRFVCSNAKIKAGDNITINPDTVGVIIVKAYRGAQPVANFRFQAVSVPKPAVGINGKRSGAITKAEIKQFGQLELFADSENSRGSAEQLPYNYLFRIISFSVSNPARDGFTIEKRCDSNIFTSEVIQIIDYLRPGQRIYFEEIIAESVNGARYNLGTLSFKIQN